MSTSVHLDNRNVVVASFVTAYARLELYNVLEKLGQNVLYYDTDSVFLILILIPKYTTSSEDKPLSARSKRMVVKEAISTHSTDAGCSNATDANQPEQIELTLEHERSDNLADENLLVESKKDNNMSTQTNGCFGCAYLVKERRKTWNKYITLKEKYDAMIKEKRSKGIQCSILLNNDDQHKGKISTTATMFDCEPETGGDDTDTTGDETTCTEDEKQETGDDALHSEEDMESDQESDAENRDSFGSENLRQEPKFIVFLSQLLLLFKFCHFCKTDSVLVESTADGSALVVESNCGNANCGQRRSVWRSQPLLPGSKVNAGDFLQSFSILVSGGSPAKVIHMFQHMGLSGISLETFYRHQRTLLLPAIFIHWQDYQRKILERLKLLESLVISGDGRHDSMGHSAKYGAYTIFCCTSPQIIHFSLIQRNEVGSSPAMEYEGFKRCMGFLLGEGLDLSTLVSDRHQTIAKHMREKLPNITHYFDLWHLKKKLHKVLSKLAKEADCTELAEWVHPCLNHLYWSATSTHSGNGRIIWAKFKSFLSHIVDKHDDLDDPLYNKCLHGELEPRKWILPDSPAYTKLSSAITKKSLVKGIKQASPLDQTSFLEGFHSVVNQFSPKMNAYSFTGIFCR
ncbi:uncharacterized protein LOC114526538 [Dendronephthya gigantea]|uniref:uncharacterized protein LOC114526538 n=1 Tax=Dendronephthya gigantea TaxID=151771 RepID=UPI00106A27D4|nr:uncharacterized protein LOC114526538 [Dendronephthya gigantea]